MVNTPRDRSLRVTDAAPVAVHLVPGTWGRHSPWHDPAGPVATALTAAGYDVRRFDWAGHNTIRGRLSAAAELAKTIVADEAAGRRVALVAHSHGGNVARTASYLARPGRPDRSIVALGTPFLVVDTNRGVIGSRPWTSAGMAVVPLGTLHAVRRAWIARSWRTVAIIELGSLSLFAAAETLLWWASRRTRREAAADLAVKVAPQDCYAQTTVINVAGDEANLALATMQLTGVVAGRITALLEWVGVATRRGWPLLAAAPIVGLTTSRVSDRHPRLQRVVLHGGFFGLSVLCSAWLPTQLLGWADTIVSGWDGAALSRRKLRRGGSRVRLTTSLAPRGTSRLVVVDVAAPQSDRGPLAHGLLPSHAAAVEAVLAAVAAGG